MAPDMRLLYVIDSLSPGGAETSLTALAPSLVARGIDLHVLPLGDRLDLAPRLADAGAHVHRRRAAPGRMGSIREVLRVAGHVQPTLIHTTLFESDVAGRIAARLAGVPSSTSLVNDSYGPSHYAEANTAKLHAARALDAATARLAERFHALSSAVATTVPPRIGVSRDLVDIIPRGRDPELFPFRPRDGLEEIRGGVDVPVNAPVVLAIGRLEPQKGFRHLLGALARVRADYPDVVLLIAGKEGRESEALRRMAQDLTLDVRFLGHRDDVAELLAASDVFCFPSEREGFGGVLIEALAVGCPVVATSIPTSREVLGGQDDPVGTFAHVGDVEGLAQALLVTLKGGSTITRHVQSGRRRFEMLYTVDASARQMHEFFLKAVATASGRRPGSAHPSSVDQPRSIVEDQS